MADAADVTSVETDTTGDPGTVVENTVLTGDDVTNSDPGVVAPENDAGNPDEGTSDDTGSEGSQLPPDTYADFTMPEGVQLDEAALAEANPLFKDLGLTQEQAQKVVDLYAKQVQAGSTKQSESFNQLMNDWRTLSKNDGEFGGDKFDENVKVARTAIDKYGTPELKQLLEDHGVGNHPEVVRFMVRVGQTLKEDVPGSTGVATSKTQDRVSILYPNSKES